MNRKIVQVLSVLLFGLLPIPMFAQCNDSLCQHLQTIVDAAVTDFREYRLNTAVGPDVSMEGTKRCRGTGGNATTLEACPAVGNPVNSFLPFCGGTPGGLIEVWARLASEWIPV